MFLLSFVCWILPILAGEPPKLNVGKLLLPHNLGLPSEYVLEVMNGDCYTWSSSNMDIASVRPLNSNEECVFKAIVSSVSSRISRHTATVFARDTINGHVLTCEVTVDSISSIDILSTTHKLYLESDPIAFQVQAKNCENDTFTTINGLSFEWTLTETGSKSNKNSVKFILYINSKYNAPQQIEFWERQGIQGSSVLVKAMQKGATTLRVKPRHESLRDVKPAEIMLTVFSNVFLYPSGKLYLLPGTRLKFRLVEVRYGEIYKESLVMDRYTLKITCSSSVSLDGNTFLMTALDYGDATVFLMEKDLAPKEGHCQQSVDIEVVAAACIKLTLTPEEEALQQFSDYIVAIKIYDYRNNDIYLPENVLVNVKFPKEYFETVSSTCNGTYFVVKPLKPGRCKIKAELLGIAMEDGKMVSFDPGLYTSREVTILEPLKIVPSYTLLPWDSSQSKWSASLYATGGNGFYEWQSSDSSVAKLSTSYGPNITVSAVNKGVATITVSDGFSNYSVCTKISIQSIGEVKILPSRVEGEVNGTIVIPLGIYGINDESDLNYAELFSDCSQVSVDIEVGEDIIALTEELHSLRCGGCRCLQFICLSAGFSWITIKHESTDIKSEAKTLVSCYKPLKLLYPDEVILPMGSSIDAVFQDGPQPWGLFPEGYHINVTDFDGSVVSLTKLNDLVYTGQDLHVYRTLCVSTGQTSLNLAVGNIASEENPYPVIERASVTVTCAVPATIHLCVRPNFIVKETLCPITEATPLIPFPVSKDVEIGVIVKDSSSRILMNISSLRIEWKIADSSLANVKFPSTVVIEVDSNGSYRKIVGAFQAIKPLGKSGRVIVTANINGYREDLLAANGIPSSDLTLNQPCRKAVEFELVENVEIVPPFLKIFNHPLNMGRLVVNKGSGYFSLVADNTDKATIRYNQNKRHIEILPLEDGFFKIYLIDLCIDPNHVITAEVHTSGISNVSVQVPDKVEVGKCVMAIVEVYDGEGDILLLSNSFPVKLKPKTDSNIISVQLEPSERKETQQTVYKIQGVCVGKTDIMFVVEVEGDERPNRTSIGSEPLSIQVYSPLHVHPSDITLVPGSSYQVTTSGGPQPDTIMHYFVKDEDIAEISKTGVITGKSIGKTIVYVQFFDPDKEVKTVSPLLQSKVRINVSPFVGIKLETPSSKIQVGTDLVLLLLGEDEDGNLHVINNQLTSITFQWSVINPEVVSLGNYVANSDSNFAIKMKALRPGFATIKVVAEVKNDRFGDCLFTSPVLQDEILIQVFDKLILTHPESGATSLLMSTNAELELRTSRDGLACINFDLSEETLVTIRDNRLFSGMHCGDAVLIISAEEEFGIVQRLTIHVQVKSTSFITVEPCIPSGTEETSSSTIPVGLSKTFFILYHDDTGQVFHATNLKIQYSLSRHDLIRVSHCPNNDTIIVETLGQGSTILKLWSRQNPTAINYMLVKTEAAIYPSNLLLTVGDVVCFEFALKSLFGENGQWSASEKSIVNIHPMSGVSVASEPGNAMITYSITGKFLTRTSVQVKPATSIRMNNGSLKHISNLQTGDPYRIQVVLSCENETGVKMRNCERVDQNSQPNFSPPFRCSLQFLDTNHVNAEEVFVAEAIFDWNTGNYYCQIRSKSETEDVSTLNSDVLIKAYLLSREQYCNELVIPSTVRMRFIPTFRIDTKELVLSERQCSESVTVSGVPEVLETLLVTPSDPELIEIVCTPEDRKEINSVKYTIAIVNFHEAYKAKEMYVKLRSPIINQCEEVNVIVDDGKAALFIPSGKWSSLVTLITGESWCLGPMLYLLLGVFVIGLSVHTYKGIIGRTPRPVDSQVRQAQVHSSGHNWSPLRHRPQLWTVPSHGVPGTRDVATSTLYPPHSSIYRSIH